MNNISIDPSQKSVTANATAALQNCTFDAITETCLVTTDEDGNMESALFALLFCVIFVLLLALLLLLICKIWSLRRSVVPSIYKIDQATGAVISAPNMTVTIFMRIAISRGQTLLQLSSDWSHRDIYLTEHKRDGTGP
ncbi:hypothetical protein Tcan_14103 [Toxocara canis]|uniref:Uncharacterized protein n=1 Tax=Toxocara canis TaxID=6265 RepID=A0A0B2V3P0_TOXCA|nr:hypothetical protein Tcan_14103 [Toxocara canis]